MSQNKQTNLQKVKYKTMAAVQRVDCFSATSRNDGIGRCTGYLIGLSCPSFFLLVFLSFTHSFIYSFFLVHIHSFVHSLFSLFIELDFFILPIQQTVASSSEHEKPKYVQTHCYGRFLIHCKKELLNCCINMR